MSGRNGTRRNLTDEKADISDAIKQVAMADRVRAIDSVGENGDRVATCSEGGLVRRAFDPVGTSRDDNSFLCGNGTGEFPSHVFTVGGACPSPVIVTRSLIGRERKDDVPRVHST